ncbi:MAG: hypothetical protein JWQ21_2828 [Herminiimonas sp.]|nr:hypothetical protein [Herminiimonas sp.]
MRLVVNRQLPLQRDSIGKDAKRLLWIYKSSHQIGDALMDLSSRVLLRNSGFHIDLFTDPHLAALFSADDIFTNVISDRRKVIASEYDLVIVDSFKSGCLDEKFARLRPLRFVTMRGYFSGPEFNRTLFSFLRMNQLLGEPDKINPDMATPYLATSGQDKHKAGQIKLSPEAVAFVIGGAAPSRTYPHWHAVIHEAFARRIVKQVVIVGSSNAVSMAERVMAENAANSDAIVNCVNQFTLLETLEIMKKCRFIVCCDGGLLHIANSAGLPVISLFDRHINPEMRLTSANKSIAIQSTGTIGDLPVEKVIEAIEKAVTLY